MEHVRFFAKVDVGNSPAGCWMWTGAKARLGYGRFWFEGDVVYAHRWAYAHLVQPLADHEQIDHLCREPGCVNPLHLEVVTASENCQRRAYSSRGPRTHCRHGHLLSGANLRVVSTTGKRVCRACDLRRHQSREGRHES